MHYGTKISFLIFISAVSTSPLLTLLFENQIFISISLNFSEWTASSLPSESLDACALRLFTFFSLVESVCFSCYRERWKSVLLFRKSWCWMVGNFIIKFTLVVISRSVFVRPPSCSFRGKGPRSHHRSPLHELDSFFIKWQVGKVSGQFFAHQPVNLRIFFARIRLTESMDKQSSAIC